MRAPLSPTAHIPMMRFRESRPGRASLWTLLDQALSSLTNFGALIVGARLLTTEGFGRFSIYYVVLILCLGAVQAVGAQVLVITDPTESDVVRASWDCVLTSAVLGSVLGLLTILAGIVVDRSHALEILVVGLCLPAIAVQDAFRFVAAATRRNVLSVACDGLWLVLLAAGVGTCLSLGVADSPLAVTLCFFISGAVSGVFALGIRGGGEVGLWLAAARRRDHLGYRFLWEYVLVRLSSQGVLLALGLLAGVVASGALRGASTLFGPLSVLFQSVSSFGATFLTRLPESRRITAILLAGAAMSSSALGLWAVIVAFPVLGRTALGATWANAQHLVTPVAIQSSAIGLATAIYLGLRVMAPRRTLAANSLASVGLLAGFGVGYLGHGVLGAAWGLAAGTVGHVVFGAVALGLELRSRQRSSLHQRATA